MKMLFTDLDGTLLNSNKVISEDTMKTIHEMLTRGKKLVLASGRPLHSILERKNTLGIPNHNVYITAFNGSQLYDCEQDKIIEEYGLSKLEINIECNDIIQGSHYDFSLK